MFYKNGPKNILFKYVKLYPNKIKYSFNIKHIEHCVKNLNININSYNKNGETLLFLATISKDINIISDLLLLGADPNISNVITRYYSSDCEDFDEILPTQKNKPFNPLSYILSREILDIEYINIVVLLLESGAKINTKNHHKQNILDFVNSENYQVFEEICVMVK